jgi:hypothetical protein
MYDEPDEADAEEDEADSSRGNMLSPPARIDYMTR